MIEASQGRLENKLRKGMVIAMKMGCFARPPKFGKRLALMAAGVLLQGFGLSVLININLGTDPCSCLTQGIIRHINISFGTAQLLSQLVMFLVVIAFDRSLIGFGTLGNMIFVGYISDFWCWVWARVVPEGLFGRLPARWGLLLPTLAVFIFGAALYMSAGLGTSPYDGIPFIIASRLPKLRFRIVRVLWDFCFMAAGFVLGGDVGIVTLGVVLFLGPVISWLKNRIEGMLLGGENPGKARRG
ncbi:MAG: hypothetical protein NC432_06285 [Roseburia sp.]|nr:hypothetical protein [Roseburia sp.]MCM1097634.1 hypothetical protein [Ruminococcus flavefaciens]